MGIYPICHTSNTLKLSNQAVVSVVDWAAAADEERDPSEALDVSCWSEEPRCIQGLSTNAGSQDPALMGGLEAQIVFLLQFH